MYKNGKVNGKHWRYAIYGTARNCSFPRGSWSNWTPITRVISAQLARADVNVCSFWYFIVYKLFKCFITPSISPNFIPAKKCHATHPAHWVLHLIPTTRLMHKPSDLHTCSPIRGRTRASTAHRDWHFRRVIVCSVHTAAHFPHSWTSEYTKFVANVFSRVFCRGCSFCCFSAIKSDARQKALCDTVNQSINHITTDFQSKPCSLQHKHTYLVVWIFCISHLSNLFD